MKKRIARDREKKKEREREREREREMMNTAVGDNENTIIFNGKRLVIVMTGFCFPWTWIAASISLFAVMIDSGRRKGIESERLLHRNDRDLRPSIEVKT